MYDDFKTLIENNKKIIIFRHLIGDGDALGSQWALYYYLKDKYPDKEIYAVGDDTVGYQSIFEKPHQISGEKFTDALAIVVDTANTARISDQRYKLCKTIVKIDHHLEVHAYGDLEIVDSDVTSSAQIVANILKEFEDNEPLKEIVAKNLYTGITSDTQSFSIPGVDVKTFETAAYLSKSNIDTGKIFRRLNAIELNVYKYKNYLANQIVFDESGLAYVKSLNKDLKKYNITHSQAKRNAGLMKNIKGIDIWVLFIEQEDNSNIFNASLRSNEIVINDVAQEFGGGGHNYASGVKSLNPERLEQLINKLKMKLEDW